jgi:hypothetical protein
VGRIPASTVSLLWALPTMQSRAEKESPCQRWGANKNRRTEREEDSMSFGISMTLTAMIVAAAGVKHVVLGFREANSDEDD